MATATDDTRARHSSAQSGIPRTDSGLSSHHLCGREIRADEMDLPSAKSGCRMIWSMKSKSRDRNRVGIVHFGLTATLRPMNSISTHIWNTAVRRGRSGRFGFDFVARRRTGVTFTNEGWSRSRLSARNTPLLGGSIESRLRCGRTLVRMASVR